ncbi:hypothetical protein FACS1894217_05680 [Clostridia bacterium]|nr:hypothetical protein FACS1894217_05680 [Clostridia bacterium]
MESYGVLTYHYNDGRVKAEPILVYHGADAPRNREIEGDRLTRIQWFDSLEIAENFRANAVTPSGWSTPRVPQAQWRRHAKPGVHQAYS